MEIGKYIIWVQLGMYECRILCHEELLVDFVMWVLNQVESNDGSATVAAPGESVTESLKTNCEMCLILIAIIPMTHEFYS